jgi:hypothetical protein
MNSRQALNGALEAVDRLVNRGGEADEVLRGVVQSLHQRIGYRFVGIAFVEGESLELGPTAGRPGGQAVAFPITFEGRSVGELRVEPGSDDSGELALLQRVATLISPYCLVGWDTGGVPWPEVS